MENSKYFSASVGFAFTALSVGFDINHFLNGKIGNN